ncbi:hypothetical protein Tco_1056536 [Tanacetum coccineum]|uniref:Uncharacterized protein n=1 Tax=Tanacetum coccineum TaxID=301880 RepID=A0ABQ5H2Z8_9ASTR
MCMFACTVSIAESTNIKEAMADHAWIEAMQEELHLIISAYVRLMAVRVPPAMSPGLSASIAVVAAMSNSAFCKRFRSSYESSPSSSPPDLPSLDL